MLVSIIVPVYNVEKYIKRCFNSITRQSFTNIECIFINDCSQDNSINLLYGLLTVYTGNISFRIINHEKNNGLSAARNTGINNAKGEYLYFLDSDDEITEHCIEYLVELAEKYMNVDIVQGNTKIGHNNFYNLWDITKRCFPEYSNNLLWLKKHFFIHPCIPSTAWNKLVRYRFIIENKLYFREGIIHEDRHWNYFIVRKIKSMAFTNNYCYIYYNNPDSIMNSNNISRSLQSRLLIIQDMLENIDDDIQREELKYIYSFLNSSMYLFDNTTENKYFINEYRKIIKLCIKKACESFDLISYFGLHIYLLPCRVYSNFIFRIVLKILLRNWKNIFSFYWCTFKK